jgi:hypothetical protein
VAAHYAGHHGEALRCISEALATPGVISNPGLHAMLLSLRGNAQRELGMKTQALESLLAASELLPSLTDNELAECAEDAATTLSVYGDNEAAAHLLGFAEKARIRAGSPINPGLRRYYDETVRRLESGLGARFAAARAAGADESPEWAGRLAAERLRVLAR